MKKLHHTFLIQVMLSCCAINAQKPNLVVIHTDEHNFRTLSCYRDNLPENEAYVWGKGLGVETLNMDKIAKEGAICMNYYVTSPVCAPSRDSLMTGLYRQNHKVAHNGQGLSKKVKTIAHILSENGYSTSYVDKWHLDPDQKKYKFGIEYKAGFDDNTHMMTAGHAPYFLVKDNKAIKGINKLPPTKVKIPKNGEIVHVTDFFADRTIDIIKRDQNKPFCVITSIPDPHTPDIAKAPYDKMYNHMDLQMPATMSAESIKKRPEWAGKKRNDATVKGFEVKKLRQYFGMVKHIDDRVGDILKTLDELNLTEKTIVIFTSDHGDMFYEHGRMNKSIPYESAMKIPFVIRYPKKIKPATVIETVQSNVDFVPTMLGLMDIKTSLTFDGENNAKDFTSDKKLIDRANYIHVSSSSNAWVALVNQKYKLVLHTSYPPTLFDLEKDPHETINFYNKKGYRDISKKLKKVLVKRMKKHNEIAYNSKRKLKM